MDLKGKAVMGVGLACWAKRMDRTQGPTPRGQQSGIDSNGRKSDLTAAQAKAGWQIVDADVSPVQVTIAYFRETGVLFNGSPVFHSGVPVHRFEQLGGA